MFLFFILRNESLYILQGCRKLIKSDSEAVVYVRKDFYFKFD